MRRPTIVAGWAIRAVMIVGLLAIGRAAPDHPAWAQTLDCAGLKARIDAGHARGDNENGSALQDQQFELDRLRTYSDSIGCGSGFFFGAPPQCDGIERRMSRLQDRIEALQQQAQDSVGDGDWRRRALIEQYNASCSRGGYDQPSDPAYDGGAGRGDPDAPGDASPDEGAAPSGPVHSKALCVRHCDGGFFPITEQASAGNLERLDQICKALCPNTEASLYTVAPDAGLETAVAPDGTQYTALPAAFRFQKTYDPTCSCKPANKSWAEALADAEALLEKNKSDVVVTKRISDAMSRPVQPNAPGAATAPAVPKPAKGGKAARTRKPANAVAATRPAAPNTAPLPEDLGQPAPAAGDPEGEALTRQFRRAEPTL